jgi:hypothetical protein
MLECTEVVRNALLKGTIRHTPPLLDKLIRPDKHRLRDRHSYSPGSAQVHRHEALALHLWGAGFLRRASVHFILLVFSPPPSFPEG